MLDHTCGKAGSTKVNKYKTETPSNPRQHDPSGTYIYQTCFRQSPQ